MSIEGKVVPNGASTAEVLEYESAGESGGGQGIRPLHDPLTLFTASRVIPLHPQWPRDVGRNAKSAVVDFGSCAQAVLAVFLESLEFDAPLVLKAAGGFHAGMLHSVTCGVYSAGMMVLGLLVGREDPRQGREGLHPIIDPARVLFKNLESEIGSSSCLETSGLDFADPDLCPVRALKARSACHSLVEKGAFTIARTLQDLIETGLLENPEGSTSPHPPGPFGG